MYKENQFEDSIYPMPTIFDAYFNNKDDFYSCELLPFEESYEESIQKEYNQVLYKAPSSTCGSSHPDSASIIGGEEVDYNDLVNKILKSKPIEELINEGFEIKKDELLRLQQQNKRKRKSKDQLDILKLYYDQVKDWSKDDIVALSVKTGMS